MTLLRAANDIDRIFRAFSDRTRLRILTLLREGELCVGDIVKVLRLSQPKVSRHLAYLRKTGLVEVRDQGPWCFYSLSKARNPFHAKILECLGSCFGEVPEIARDSAKAKDLRISGGCCPDSRTCDP